MSTEDFKVFGDQWVYCAQHRSVHTTNWCTVSISDKVALGVTSPQEGIEKCRRLGLSLYCDDDKKETK